MEIRMGIKQLVEFIYRSGSIDSRFTGTDRALLGSKIHRQLQKQAGDNYKAEQFLKLEVCEGDILYILHGRADGIIVNNDGYIIDEIKTVSTPLEYVDENYSKAHWAQGCFYGYIVCKENSLEEITVQLTYYNIDTDEIKRIEKQFILEELEKIVTDTLVQYRKWAVLSDNLITRRNISLKQLQFPYEKYREGQRQMAVAVYNTIRNQDRLFVCAPTGTGKTLSALFPALKAIGEELADKVFYLTAKTITGKAATEAVALLYSKHPGLQLKMLTITAKDKVCFMEQRKCDPVSCPYANGYFDKINDVLYDTIECNNVFLPERITEIAEQHSLCPYELSLDISEWCDMVVCDYNYLFDPTAHLQRFFDVKKGDYIFLIDEAHNLPDRAREMYSAYLDKKSFFAVKKSLDKKEKKLIKALNEINNAFIEFRHYFDDMVENRFVQKTVPDSMEKPLRKFVKECAEYFDRNKKQQMDEELQTLYFDSKFFLKIFEGYDDKYVTLIFKSGDNVGVKLYCVDPSAQIDTRLDSGISTVAFSATLTPLDYYRSIIGGKGSAAAVPSPFMQNNLGLYVADSISTRYNDRTATLDEICDMLYEFINGKKGNYIVYFPSYSYMQSAVECFTGKYLSVKITVQQQGMTDEERLRFIHQFDNVNTDGLLGFCVMGGIYGEGIDLTGERLIGCAVVGVGLPQINFQLDTLKNYYDETGVDGFAYAYQYPGMNKVMQAAGRVIRTDSDRGVVLLIDSRFTTRRYLANMPAHWSHLKRVGNTPELKNELNNFWNKKD